MTCKECEVRGVRQSWIFNVACQDCRNALVLTEDCKIIRGYIAEQMSDYGDTNWKVEPNCGCEKFCVRNQNAEQARQAVAKSLAEDQRNELRSMRRTRAK